MDTFNGTKLTLQIGDTVTTWEVDHQDISIDDLLNALHGMCVSHTFISHSFVDGCRDFYDSLESIYHENEEKIHDFLEENECD